MRPLSVVPGKDAVTVTLGSESFTLSAGEIDALLTPLIELRSQMEPKLAIEPKPPAPFRVLNDWSWLLQKADDGLGFFFHIAHPGAGWLNLRLNPDTAHKIRKVLHKAGM